MLVITVRWTDSDSNGLYLTSLSILSFFFYYRVFALYLSSFSHNGRLMTSTATNGTSPELPNPNTPLAFFPPDLAYEVSVSIYTFVGSLTVSIHLLFFKASSQNAIIMIVR